MPQISKKPISAQLLENLFDLFFEIMGKKNNKNEFNIILTDVLTPTERVMIAKRIALMYLLMKEVDYHTICKVLKVSTATVAKFRLILEKSDGVIPIYKDLIKHEKIGMFLEEFLLTVRGPGIPGVNWRQALQRKNELERRKKQGI